MSRQTTLDHYRQQPDVDVLIIGAGINGIGTFRDLALQGVPVLIVDKADFCSGASAASTRMAHGGIRYLENGEFRLVRESLAERNRLLKNAPHAVRPLLFTIPVYSRFSGLLNAPLKFVGLLKRPSERGQIVIKIGMMLYDWYTRKNRATGTHRMLSRSEALKRHPALNPAIIAAATYYDATMAQAERIGLELVLDAEAEFDQALALNYVSCVGGSGDSVRLRDDVTGDEFDVRPKVVVNAGGAWIDFVNRAVKHDTRFIGGTKGSHIIVDHPELRRNMGESAVFFEYKDGRMVIFAPFGDKVILGASDIRVDDPEDTIASDEEIDYFLNLTTVVFPTIKVTRDQIVYHFSGVRPLPSADVEFAGMISRDHNIRVVGPDDTIQFPILSLIGGKWTTYRAFAGQTTDMILPLLNRTRRAGTEELRIGGGKDYPADASARDAWLKRVAAQTGVLRARLDTLFERYGTRAAEVAAFIAAEPDTPLSSLLGYSTREITFIATREKVVHLDDVILRRSILAFLGAVDGAVLRELASVVGAALGWTEAQTQAEIARTADILERQHGVPASRMQ